MGRRARAAAAELRTRVMASQRCPPELPGWRVHEDGTVARRAKQTKLGF